MGEVYRARDTRLDRSVAIKIVPDQTLKQRFDREAKIISSLNHPNICAFDGGKPGSKPVRDTRTHVAPRQSLQ